jgi:hypothetical protein
MKGFQRQYKVLQDREVHKQLGYLKRAAYSYSSAPIWRQFGDVPAKSKDASP